MPTDSLLLSIAVSCVFLGFAIAIAVLDRRTTSWQRSKLAERKTASVEPVNKKTAQSGRR